MKNKWIKRVLLGAAAVFMLLVAVLGVHIYLVTRPKAPDEHTIVMARIDIKEAFNKEQADKMAGWMNLQKGIDHVFINPETQIVVFTFLPIKTSANAIVSDFKTHFNLTAERYVPSAEEMKGGCPVASTSTSYKAVAFFKHLF